jgi:hypothetical protein
VRAFQRLGNDVRFIGYRDLLGDKYHDIIRIMWSRSGIFRDFSKPLWLTKLNEIFFETASCFSPHLILSIKGETLLPKYITKLRKQTGARLALWFPDDPRFFNSLTVHIAPYYDVVFTSSQWATNLYRSISVNNVHRLPFACDPEIHKGILDSQNLLKRALFIGTYSPKRYSFIKNLVRDEIPIDVIGSKWPFPFNKYVVNPSVVGSQYVRRIQSYSVTLNMHQDLAYGPNMRTFEVTGSGGVLLSDRAEDITNFFLEESEMLVYDSLEDAAQKIKYLIKNPDASYTVAANGQKKCHNRYTYDERARQILKFL